MESNHKYQRVSLTYMPHTVHHTCEQHKAGYLAGSCPSTTAVVKATHAWLQVLLHIAGASFHSYAYSHALLLIHASYRNSQHNGKCAAHVKCDQQVRYAAVQLSAPHACFILLLVFFFFSSNGVSPLEREVLLAVQYD